MNKKWIVAALVAAALSGLSACGQNSKAVQQYNDAPTKGQNDNSPAQIINMPDGFSNVAFKCVRGDGIYVIFHQDKAYGGLTVVDADPACAS